MNRLAREHPDDVAALLAAAERVKAAQLGRGHAAPLATAIAGHRAALDRLRERAGVMLRDAGGGAAPDKLQNTLTAAAVDSQARRALQAGQLERELTAPGFDVFAGARPPATRRTGRRMGVPPRAEAPAPLARTAAAAPSAGAKAEERRQEREAARAKRQERIAQARTALTEAQRQAVAAHKDVTEAEGRLRELLEQVQETRRELRERTGVARQQDSAVKHARRGLRTAERKTGS